MPPASRSRDKSNSTTTTEFNQQRRAVPTTSTLAVAAPLDSQLTDTVRQPVAARVRTISAVSSQSNNNKTTTTITPSFKKAVASSYGRQKKKTWRQSMLSPATIDLDRRTALVGEPAREALEAMLEVGTVDPERPELGVRTLDEARQAQYFAAAAAKKAHLSKDDFLSLARLIEANPSIVSDSSNSFNTTVRTYNMLSFLHLIFSSAPDLVTGHRQRLSADKLLQAAKEFSHYLTPEGESLTDAELEMIVQLVSQSYLAAIDLALHSGRKPLAPPDPAKWFDLPFSEFLSSSDESEDSMARRAAATRFKQYMEDAGAIARAVGGDAEVLATTWDWNECATGIRNYCEDAARRLVSVDELEDDDDEDEDDAEREEEENEGDVTQTQVQLKDQQRMEKADAMRAAMDESDDNDAEEEEQDDEEEDLVARSLLPSPASSIVGRSNVIATQQIDYDSLEEEDILYGDRSRVEELDGETYLDAETQSEEIDTQVDSRWEELIAVEEELDSEDDDARDSSVKAVSPVKTKAQVLAAISTNDSDSDDDINSQTVSRVAELLDVPDSEAEELSSPVQPAQSTPKQVIKFLPGNILGYRPAAATSNKYLDRQPDAERIPFDSQSQVDLDAHYATLDAAEEEEDQLASDYEADEEQDTVVEEPPLRRNARRGEVMRPSSPAKVTVAVVVEQPRESKGQPITIVLQPSSGRARGAPVARVGGNTASERENVVPDVESARGRVASPLRSSGLLFQPEAQDEVEDIATAEKPVDDVLFDDTESVMDFGGGEDDIDVERESVRKQHATAEAAGAAREGSSYESEEDGVVHVSGGTKRARNKEGGAQKKRAKKVVAAEIESGPSSESSDAPILTRLTKSTNGTKSTSRKQPNSTQMTSSKQGKKSRSLSQKSAVIDSSSDDSPTRDDSMGSDSEEERRRRREQSDEEAKRRYARVQRERQKKQQSGKNGDSSRDAGTGAKTRTPWTAAQTKLLISEMTDFGTDWNRMMHRHGPSGMLSQTFANRTGPSLKDKARSLENRRLRDGLGKPTYLAGVSASKGVVEKEAQKKAAQKLSSSSSSSSSGSSSSDDLDEDNHEKLVHGSGAEEKSVSATGKSRPVRAASSSD